MKRVIAFISVIFFAGNIAAKKNNLIVSANNTAAAFPLFSSIVMPDFYYDAADAKVVAIAVKAFANDVSLISGKQIKLNASSNISSEYAIIAGTVGQSKLIDALVKNKEIDVTAIKKKWECFVIQILSKGKNKQLVIAGSDRRGTAFGIFHLSRAMGVSPLVWWADVLPEKKQALFVSGNYTAVTPSVQYRGIFINDEDWGMQPWAAKKMDTDIKDIGPKTYAKVFELLLRLKANYIWPAMHPCTKAFYYYKDNPKVADDYAIVVGGSHCEPMLRNNVCEWAETYEEEYKKKPGEWRYDVNKDEIYTYWNDRIKEAVPYESVFTVGMRGVHDGSMPGPKDPGEKVKLLENVIKDQREILQRNFKKEATALPQIFVPYKEVLSLYRRGMQLPDDVTIIWPDDNYGYIRQLPNETEQKRSGGNGVYYHLSYWGSPADYLWLSTTSPALIGYEMKKAYEYGAKKLWVFNVGDIKPAELEMQFAMDMAYDINTYTPEKPSQYIRRWAAETFGKNVSERVTVIKDLYYRLSVAGKPEHLDKLIFTAKEIDERILICEKLTGLLDSCTGKIDKQLADAFFQLIGYPVESACFMNYKILRSKLAIMELGSNRLAEAKNNAAFSATAYSAIQTFTERYNRFIAAGKWNGMMSDHPRDQKVFDAPAAFDSLKVQGDASLAAKEIKEAQRVKIITAGELYQDHHTAHCMLLPGIGVSGASLIPDKNSMPAAASVSFTMPLTAGNYSVVVKCLPAFAMEKEKQLSYTVTVNNTSVQTANVHAEAETSAWKENVLCGYAQGVTVHTVAEGKATINIILQNKNLAITQIEMYKTR